MKFANSDGLSLRVRGSESPLPGSGWHAGGGVAGAPVPGHLMTVTPEAGPPVVPIQFARPVRLTMIILRLVFRVRLGHVLLVLA